MIRLTFRIKHPKTISFVWLSGSIPELGEWKKQNAIQMKTIQEMPADFLLSEAVIEVKSPQRDTVILYSFFTENEETIFESKKNRKIKIIAGAEGKKSVTDIWGKIPKSIQSKIVVRFKIRYVTSFGQNLYVFGNCKELGSGEVSKAIKMNYVNDELENWQVDVNFSRLSLKKDITFSFLVRDNENNTIKEAIQRVLPVYSDFKRGYIEVGGSFYGNLPPHEYIMNRAPFSQIFSKPENKEMEKLPKIDLWEDNNANKIPVNFQVIWIEPLNGYQIRIVGNCPSLGNWDVYNSVPVLNNEFPVWKNVIAMSPEEFPIEYKYVICPQKSLREIPKDQFYFEVGENRKFKLKAKIDGNDGYLPNVVVIDGGKLRLNKEIKPPRIAGVAIPIFSIRSLNGLGVGEFQDLELMAEWASRAHLKFIQVLPINDTRITGTWKDSYPYSALSSMSLHPIYANIDRLDPPENLMEIIEKKKKEVNEMVEDKETHQQVFKYPTLDYPEITQLKMYLLRQIFNERKEAFKESKELQEFIKENKFWLPAYALLCAFGEKYEDADHSKWPDYRNISREAINALTSPSSLIYDQVLFYMWVQFVLDEQLRDAVSAVNKHGIALMGDLPIGVDFQSSDVWTNPHIFRKYFTCGAPPDYFAQRGQNWYFPAYDWEQMEKDHFQYWKNRLRQLSKYFQAMRVDHILGWFRMWEVPIIQHEGLFGHFWPSIPIYRNELLSRGLWDLRRLCEPYLPYHVLIYYFMREIKKNDKEEEEEVLIPNFTVQDAEKLISIYFQKNDIGRYSFKDEYSTQAKIKDKVTNPHLVERLFKLSTEICLIGDPYSETFYPRYGLEKTFSYQEMDQPAKNNLSELANDYFHRRQDDLWKKSARKKLPLLTETNNMLIVAEDLGLKPTCVDSVLDEMKIPGMRIERMSPDEKKSPFDHIENFQYMSMTSTSTHDTENLRQWWEILKDKDFYWRNILHRDGNPTPFLEINISEQIIYNHLNSKSMICIIPLQDWFSLTSHLRLKMPITERINYPPNRDHHWEYQMQIPIEDLINRNQTFTSKIAKMISDTNRDF
ncbi:hypothetical protein M0811_05131 [Anaeramoeba ignava]|uniref:4-alpha-glucanotransferase n=1 Tax=Anaeramoeba ignava TaxID=1746090 RepID=A0A9Q0RG34_ANAIG|nr:hypothetical protein M0811_05131 [Anaeramoeba ignava]